jgi:hypothetical protein
MRPKGSGKTPGSGRKKGTINKSSLPLREKAQALGIDPFEILLHFAAGNWKQLGYESETQTRYTSGGQGYEVKIITPDHRIKGASDACQYLHPKLKQVEASIKGILDERPLEHLSDEELESYDVS